MNYKIIIAAFSTLFLAEMGDKTQLAVLTMSASTGRPFSVFIGAAAALITVTALGAVAGESLGRVISPQILSRVAAVSFIAIGVWMLVSTSSAAS